MLEGRKYRRTDKAFFVRMSSVGDPLLTDLAFVENRSTNGVQLATGRSWEVGSHVDVESVASNLENLKARTRVVYCKAVGPKKFAVGLNILSHEGEQFP